MVEATLTSEPPPPRACSRGSAARAQEMRAQIAGDDLVEDVDRQVLHRLEALEEASQVDKAVEHRPARRQRREGPIHAGDIAAVEREGQRTGRRRVLVKRGWQVQHRHVHAGGLQRGDELAPHAAAAADHRHARAGRRA
jgi:hypothetical protein